MKASIPPSLKKARKIADELENANYHSLTGIPERIYMVMRPYIGERVMLKLMRALERELFNVR